MATRTRIEKKPSNLPYLAAAGVFAALALALPLNTLAGLLGAGGLTALAYFLIRRLRLFPDIEIRQEEEVPYDELALDEVLEKGNGWVAELEEANRRIADPAVSADIRQIGELAKRILGRVAADPAQAGNIRKLISYYLPTLTKLLNYYAELERETFQSGNVVSSKEKIARMLETVIAAFKAQLDSLYEKDAVDIASDIQVMEALMAKEGFNTAREENHE